jgi:cytochrome c-type biogenesis protein CcmH
MKILRSFRLWAAAVAVLGLSASLSMPAASNWQSRVAHLESLVKCPSCQDLSVAQSNATSSLAVRHEIVTMVQRGESDTQILTTIERSYGPSVLLSPTLRGVGIVLWAGPVVAVAVMAAILWRLRRRR